MSRSPLSQIPSLKPTVVSQLLPDGGLASSCAVITTSSTPYERSRKPGLPKPHGVMIISRECTSCTTRPLDSPSTVLQRTLLCHHPLATLVPHSQRPKLRPQGRQILPAMKSIYHSRYFSRSPRAVSRKGAKNQVPMLVGVARVESPSQGARGGFTSWKARISKMQRVLNGRGEKLGEESYQEWYRKSNSLSWLLRCLPINVSQLLMHRLAGTATLSRALPLEAARRSPHARPYRRSSTCRTVKRVSPSLARRSECRSRTAPKRV